MQTASFIRYVTALRVLVVVSGITFAGEELAVLFGNEPVALFINNEIWSRPMSNFQIMDRVRVWGIVSASSLFWFYALYQFWLLCGFYGKGRIFSPDNARCFLRVGWGLCTMAVLNSLTIPLAGYYLLMRGITPAMPDMGVLEILDINFLVAGLFFWLIARIMEHAAVIQAEADLTI